MSSSASCPICGKTSPIVDGQYGQDSRGNLHASLWLTPDQAARLRSHFHEIERVAQSRRFNDDEARSRIDELLDEVAAAGNPEVADEYRKRASPGDRKTWARSAKATVVGLAAVMAFTTDFIDFTERVAGAWEFFSSRASSSGTIEVHDPTPDDGWSIPDQAI